MALRLLVLADLEELDTDLPRRRIELVELLRRCDERALDVVGGGAVGDADDVDWLSGFRVVFVLQEVGFEDSIELLAGWGGAAGSDLREDPVDFGGVGDVAVFRGVLSVEEEDIDAVSVVGGADGRDVLEGFLGLSPQRAGHGAGVVDQEDGVEAAEEGVGVVIRCSRR